MWKNFRLLYLLLFLYLLSAPLFSQQDAQQTVDQLQMTSSAIKNNLLLVKQQSVNMKQQLESVSNNLKISEEEREKWKAQSMELSSSLTSINESLNESYENIIRLEEKVKAKNKTLAVLLIILVIRLAAMILGYVLYAKGIKVPRWLDILL